MLSILFFAAAWAACLAKSNEYYSYSPAVGSAIGIGFSATGAGSITGVRVWELTHSYITGFQLRYGTTWGKVIGRKTTIELKMELFEGEAITQVSGKYNPSNYIYQLFFVTNKGRSLIAGLSFKTSFNFYATHAEAELRILSGRYNSAGITALGAHWGIIDSYDDKTKAKSKN